METIQVFEDGNVVLLMAPTAVFHRVVPVALRSRMTATAAGPAKDPRRFLVSGADGDLLLHLFKAAGTGDDTWGIVLWTADDRVARFGNLALCEELMKDCEGLRVLRVFRVFDRVYAAPAVASDSPEQAG